MAKQRRRVRKRRRPAHPRAVCPELYINDLFEFCDLYEHRKDGYDLKDAAKLMGTTSGNCNILINTIEKCLEINNIKPDFIRRDMEADDPDRTTTGLFYRGIARIIEDLRNHIEDCRKGEQRVVIEASDYSVLVALPSVLSQSGYLKSHPDIYLDIRRSFWHQFLPDLEKGHIDLALGPAVPHNEQILDSTKLYSLPRAIIYNSKHKFISGKTGKTLKLADLAQETVFVVTNKNLPEDYMKKILPLPKKPGRHIYVDSTAYMYPYIENDFGVGIAYDYDYAPLDSTPLSVFGFTPLTDQGVRALEYRLYYRKDRKLSPPAEDLKQAIIDYAPTIFKHRHTAHLRP